MNIQKNIKIIFIGFFLLLFFTIKTTFALDVNLKSNKNNIWVWSIVKIDFKINSNWWWNINIENIKNLENFKILGQSQSQSSSSQIISNNWKIKNKTIINYDIILTLQAIKKWDFEIWPAIVKQNWKEIRSNTIKIHVNKWSILNQQIGYNPNNNLSSNQNFNNTKNVVWNTNNLSQSNNIPKIKELEDIQNYKIQEHKDYSLLLVVLIIIWILWFLLYNKNSWIINNEKIKEEKENSKLDDTKIDFEENIEKIEYPETNDEKFLDKIINIVKIKIKNKYNLKNIDNKWLKEILEEIENPEEELEKLIDLIIKSKYSNNVEFLGEILTLTKNI